MTIALAIMAGLGVISLALNYILSKYLFRIISTVDGPAARIKNGIAYDGKYYPCNLLVQILCNQSQDAMITDFSKYETHNLIGMIVQSTKSEMEEFGGEELDIKPVLVKNAIVYQPVEGCWSWKLSE